MEIDGVDVTGVVAAPNTGSWGTFQWVGKGGVSLTAGQHILKMYANAQYFNLDKIRTLVDQSAVQPPPPPPPQPPPPTPPPPTPPPQTPPPPQPQPGTRSPYTGTPAAVPGFFEAENFDKGGEGVGYHKNAPGNGGTYRPNEGVDIIKVFPGYAVTNLATGEWLEYTINVTRTGTYRFDAAVSSVSSVSRFHFEVDRIDVTGIINVPKTGSLTSFQWVGKGGIVNHRPAHLQDLCGCAVLQCRCDRVVACIGDPAESAGGTRTLVVGVFQRVIVNGRGKRPRPRRDPRGPEA